jgi:hypothetical protein
MNTKSIFTSLIFISFLSVLLTIPKPAYAQADILINEIAWMGTTGSANAEWIELYNPSSNPIALDGWSLAASDGSPTINLTGSLPALGYFMLERTSDETLPGIIADQIFSGSLGNSGEHLILKDNLGVVVDEVDNSSGWSGGDNISKQTMQRSGNSWITADPTPGVKNSEISNTVTTTGSSTTTGTSTPAVSTNSKKVTDESGDEAEVTMIKPDPKYTARMVIPDYESAGATVPLVALVKQDGKKDMVSGRFVWSLGDGREYVLRKNGKFSYSFKYPGDYTVTLTYYSDQFKEEPDSIHQKVIHIVPDAIRLLDLTQDGGVILENQSTHDIDLYGWEISSEGFLFTFPKYTIARKGTKLTISSDTLGFHISTIDHAIVLNPSHRQPVF